MGVVLLALVREPRRGKVVILSGCRSKAFLTILRDQFKFLWVVVAVLTATVRSVFKEPLLRGWTTGVRLRLSEAVQTQYPSQVKH
jgi:hypothetical protein